MTDTQKVLFQVGATALIAAIGHLLSLAKDFSRSARRQRIVEEEMKRLAYWQAWYSTKPTPQGLAASKRFRSEVDKSVRVIEELYRYWPLPEIWSKQEYRKFLSKQTPLRIIMASYPPPNNPKFKRMLTWANVTVKTSFLLATEAACVHFMWRIHRAPFDLHFSEVTSGMAISFMFVGFLASLTVHDRIVEWLRQED